MMLNARAAFFFSTEVYPNFCHQSNFRIQQAKKKIQFSYFFILLLMFAARLCFLAAKFGTIFDFSKAL